MQQLGFFIIFLMAALAAVIFYLEIRYLIGKFLGIELLSKRKAVVLNTFFIGTGMLLFYAFGIEPGWIEVRHVDIFTDNLKKAEFTLVQFSDFHCDRKNSQGEKTIKLINSQDPDLIVFTGDSLNEPAALPAFRRVLSRLHARLGKLAVNGNWDVWYWSALGLFEGTGFRELNGDVQVYAKDGEFASVGGMNPDQSIDFRELYEKLLPKSYNIFLYHYPHIPEKMENLPVDLFLSGHTHGGQIALPLYGALVTDSRFGKKYESGLYSLKNEQRLYVNRGIGMAGGLFPKLRFGARPEITVFHIKPLKGEDTPRDQKGV